MRKTRLFYLTAFLILLLAEICIGLFVHDRFIRPYGGDVLVALLLCCLVKVIFPRSKGTALWVFAVCLLTEAIQLLQLPTLLGMEGTVLAIVLGSTFDWLDLLCYLVGCGLFAAVAGIKE